MRSTAPFAVSAAPAEAGHDMGVGTADTVTAYTEGHAHSGLISLIANVLCGLSVVGAFSSWFLCVELSPNRPMDVFSRIVSCHDRNELRRVCSGPARTLNCVDDLEEMARVGLASACSVDLYRCLPPWNFYVVIGNDGHVERIVYYAD